MSLFKQQKVMWPRRRSGGGPASGLSFVGRQHRLETGRQMSFSVYNHWEKSEGRRLRLGFDDPDPKRAEPAGWPDPSTIRHFPRHWLDRQNWRTLFRISA